MFLEGREKEISITKNRIAAPPSSAGTERENTPFFIISCGRSGSTLLSRMLNQHPRIAVSGESHLFNIFYPWLAYYGNLSDRQNQERLVTDILSTFHIRNWTPPLNKEQVLARIVSPNFTGVVEAVMKAWADSQGKPRWGEKTPQHVYFWREILECFPQGKIVHIVRDGRDVAASFIRAQFGPKTYYSAAKRWVRELEEIDQLKVAVHPDRFFELSYEDLLDHPMEQLSKLCDFLGEPCFPGMLEFYKSDPSNYVENINLINLKQPLMQENKQKWRKQMKAGDLRIVEAVAWKTLKEYGYELALNPPPSLSKTEKVSEHYIKSLPRKWAAMAVHRNGQAYEWSKFKIYFRLRTLDRLR